MEKRAFLAVVLMAAVLILYQTFSGPADRRRPPAAAAANSSRGEARRRPAPAPARRSRAESRRPPCPAAPAEPRPPQRLARVTAPLYDAVVSSEGGKLQEFTLKYRGEKPMVVVGDLGPPGW